MLAAVTSRMLGWITAPTQCWRRALEILQARSECPGMTNHWERTCNLLQGGQIRKTILVVGFEFSSDPKESSDAVCCWCRPSVSRENRMYAWTSAATLLQSNHAVAWEKHLCSVKETSAPATQAGWVEKNKGLERNLCFFRAMEALGGVTILLGEWVASSDGFEVTLHRHVVGSVWKGQSLLGL